VSLLSATVPKRQSQPIITIIMVLKLGTSKNILIWQKINVSFGKNSHLKIKAGTIISLYWGENGGYFEWCT
jgi:hypothetical protein